MSKMPHADTIRKMQSDANDHHKAFACDGRCGLDEEKCKNAHSVHSWNPRECGMFCDYGKQCWSKETTCNRIHDGSLADKIRCANYYGIKFVIPYQPPKVPYAPDYVPKVKAKEPVDAQRANQSKAAVAKEPVDAQRANQSKADPLYELQVEKAMIQSELEALNIAQKRLELRMLEFKKKASNYWEAGTKELEF